jgi:3' terminal RNA ribose 2'-O-methyltransferase Hen1
VLLTITNTHAPATDLGYLLHKNPARAQSFKLSFGQAHVFYPEASPERCTAALLLDVDPIGLVRGGDGTLRQYVNDRPYVASSFLSVAISRVFGTALSGKSKERPELAGTPLPLRTRISVLPSRGGEDLLRRLFEPLGYEVSSEGYPLDEKFLEWGESPYYTVGLSAVVRLRDLLRHLYVLVPVLDDDKHYWVGDEEVEKLLRSGEEWLAGHPERGLISERYLKHQGRLTREALLRLMEDEETENGGDLEEEAVEERISLGQQRLGAVVAALRSSGARRVLDLGCGEGKLLAALIKDKSFEEITGMDVSARSLEIARDRLRLDRHPRTGADGSP